ncbi:MAG: hypothetical protein NXH95_21495 [Pseudomonadaceae bacterium]|nr:hypothetical protein [Pseudomonadaceae bacterium]
MYQKYRKILLVVIALTSHQIAIADSWSDVAINGQRLTSDQLQLLEQQIGGKVAPGIYLADANGCWLNLSNATSGCLGQGNVSTFSRYGSGERNAKGDWNHYSRAAELGVGGTSDGCIYTTSGWSNC